MNNLNKFNLDGDVTNENPTLFCKRFLYNKKIKFKNNLVMAKNNKKRRMKLTKK